jgi:hypothetical protein
MATPCTPRAAVAAFQLALVQLLEAAGVSDIELTDLSVNVDGRALRIDIVRLTEDGRHIGEWLRGYSINPYDLETFGTPVGLPTSPGPAH